MYNQGLYVQHGVTIKTVGYNPYVNVQFSTTGPAHPIVPSSSPRRAFRSTPPASSGVKTCNLSSLLPSALQSTAAGSPASSTSSTGVWNSRSLSHTNRRTTVQTTPPPQRHNRRRSPSVASQLSTQNTWVTRSRTPETVAAPLKVRKIKTSHKKQQTKSRKPQTKEEKIAAIYNKGEKFGKLSGGVWYKAPEGGKAPARKPNQQRRPAAKKQRAARRVARKPVTSTQTTASPAALKTLKKLRKKVKQCKKIQESLDRGLKVEDNQLSKLKQLKEFKQQIALLEQEVSTGKAIDRNGFQRVQKQRRK